MTGTFGGALEARGIPAGGGRLQGFATGEIETEGKVLVIKRIHVRYELEVDEDADRETIERVHGFHADHCPVARSIRDAIDVSTSLNVVVG
ncbi:MAG: OsmC family protein [Nitriliruptorales bacterium]|nr:OsmC family protein [Nitriliruptorales bacterium]